MQPKREEERERERVQGERGNTECDNKWLHLLVLNYLYHYNNYYSEAPHPSKRLFTIFDIPRTPRLHAFFCGDELAKVHVTNVLWFTSHQ